MKGINYVVGNNNNIGSALAFRTGQFIYVWRVCTCFISFGSNYTNIPNRNRSKSNLAEYRKWLGNTNDANME